MRIGGPCRTKYLLVRCIRFSIAYILHDRSRKQIYILLYNTNMISQTLQLDISHVHAVQTHASAAHIVKPGDQTAEGCFSRTGTSHKGHIFSCLYRQIHMAEHFLLALLIVERDIPECNLSLHIPQFHCIGYILDIRRNGHDLQEPGVTTVSVLELLCKGDQLLHRICKVIDIQKHGHQVLHRHFPSCHEKRTYQKHRDSDQGSECAHAGVIGSHVFITTFLGVHKTLIAFLEFLHLFLLVGKRFHHTDAGKAVLNLGIDIRDPRPVFPEC